MKTFLVQSHFSRFKSDFLFKSSRLNSNFYIKLNENIKISLNTIVFIDIISFFLSVTVENYNSLQKWNYYFWEKERLSVICVSFVRPLSTSITYAILCVCAGFCQSARGFWVSESNPLIPSFYVPVLWSVLVKTKKLDWFPFDFWWKVRVELFTLIDCELWLGGPRNIFHDDDVITASMNPTGKWWQ